MPRVLRLVTLADSADDGDARGVSVAARHEAVLDDGRRVLLLGGRGWTETVRGARAYGVDESWALLSEEDVAESARMVVGPDEPFDDHSPEDMESDHWNALAETLRAEGVLVDAAELQQLPHDVVLSQALRARLGPRSDTPPDTARQGDRRPAGPGESEQRPDDRGQPGGWARYPEER